MTAEPEAEPYDPHALAHRRDPGAAFARLREHHPVHHVRSVDPNFYVVSRSQDVEALARDVDTWRNGHGVGLTHTPDSGVMNTTDGPAHDRQRAAILRDFVPAAVKALRPRVQAIVDELFAAFAPRGRGDFVEAVAFPLPAMVIAEMLGAPATDRDWIKTLSDEVLRGMNGDPPSVAAAARAQEELKAYLFTRIDERAAAHAAGAGAGDDLLGHMVEAWKVDGVLSRDEVCALGRVLLVAGHETTTSLIGLMMGRLLSDPTLAPRLRDRPELQPVFVEEVLRLDAPVQGLFRTSVRDAVVGGVAIPAGSKAQLLFASANQDPERFAEAERFSLDRNLRALRQQSAAFGIGLHFCIGAPIARLEAELALERMLSDLPEAEPDGEPEWVKPFVLRGYQSLPIRWRTQA